MSKLRLKCSIKTMRESRARRGNRATFRQNTQGVARSFPYAFVVVLV